MSRRRQPIDFFTRDATRPFLIVFGLAVLVGLITAVLYLWAHRHDDD